MLAAVLVLAVAANGPCDCPNSIGAQAGAEPLAVVSARSTFPGLVACGHLDRREGNDTIASEFDVFVCATMTPILTFGAEETARIHAEASSLHVTGIESWPFGPGWTWVWVPVWSYTVAATKNGPLVTKTLVIKAPELTAPQVTEALDQLADARAIPTERYYDVIGRLLAAALTGSERARRAFETLPDVLRLDGHAAETYERALKTYRAYYPGA